MYATRKNNGHISVASNSALKLATGEFVAFLDHDDELRPHSLLEVAKVVNVNPAAKLIYSDEDKMEMCRGTVGLIHVLAKCGSHSCAFRNYRGASSTLRAEAIVRTTAQSIAPRS